MFLINKKIGISTSLLSSLFLIFLCCANPLFFYVLAMEYVASNHRTHHDLWNTFGTSLLAPNSNHPWIIGGDLNYIRSNYESSGSNGRLDMADGDMLAI